MYSASLSQKFFLEFFRKKKKKKNQNSIISKLDMITDIIITIVLLVDTCTKVNEEVR